MIRRIGFRALFSLACALALALAPNARVYAQERPRGAPERPRGAPPRPAADDPPAAAGPGEGKAAEDRLLESGEVERVKAELARISAERRRLKGEEQTVAFESTPLEELSGQILSPVLKPRRESLGLTLEQAIRETIKNNPDYLIALYAARASWEGIPQAEATFDPVLGFSGTWTEIRSPLFSALPATITGFPSGLSTSAIRTMNLATTLTQVFKPGTSVSLSYNEARTKTENLFSLNPSYQPSLSLSVSQPLLRGFGVSANTAGIDIARFAALSSDADLADAYMGGVLALESAYWALVQAEEDLKAQERSLSNALEILKQQRARLEHKVGTPLDVTIAMAGVAQAREGVILAENSLETARDSLLRLVRPTTDLEKWDLFLVPLELPTLESEAEQSTTAVIQEAFQRRPDYYQAQLAIKSAARSLEYTENQALPSLNLIGSWKQEGLGGQHHNAWSSLGSGRFYTWAVGVELELPIFLRAEQARVSEARYSLESARSALTGLEATVVQEVRSAIRNIRTSKARIKTTYANKVLAGKRLEATRSKLEAGAAVPRDVQEDLVGLATAESDNVQAYISYRLALSNLKKVQGTLLDDYLEELPPRAQRVIRR